MTQLFANNAASELASAVTSGAVSLTLKTGGGAKFPTPSGGDFFLVTLYQKVGQDEINHEIVKCTARAGDVLTVVRAQEGTTARAFSVDDPVELRLTAGSMSAKQDGVPVIAYDNRGSLRTNTTAGRAIVDGLGLFAFEAGSTEPDDDESCFATATGRWLLEAVHWDVVDAWQLPEVEERNEYDEDEPQRWAAQAADAAAAAAPAAASAEFAASFPASFDARFPASFASNFANSFASKVLTGTAASAITSVAAVSQVSFTGTVTGAAVGDRVIATPPNALGACIAAYARVTATNTVTVYLNNPSAASQTLVADTWQITVIKS